MSDNIFEGAKKLGFGLMRLPLLDPKDESSVDIEHMKKMVDAYMEAGFTYFDTAIMYCSGRSESAVKEALTSRYPRESYTLATKLHSGFFKDKADRDVVFNRQLEKTGAQYFDYYLIHDIEAVNYDRYKEMDCFNWALEKKAQGLIKHLGFSFHDTAELLEKVISEHPEMEFVQLQINYLDWESNDVQSRLCYEVARRHNLPIVVMEPVKGGKLANVPESVESMLKEAEPDLSVASWAVRFAASCPGVEMVLSGMSNMDQMNDNLSYMKDFKPLKEEENALVLKAGEIIAGREVIPCTGCAYCTGGCPVNIPIPRYFDLYSEYVRSGEGKSEYDELSATAGKASECLECGQCEEICPQHLPIISNLKKVAGALEG